MPVQSLSVEEFLQFAKENLIVDVRSPHEFQHAHIPQSVSLPLFDDEERKIVGITYKQQSREQAIKVGLDFFGPKMKTIINTVENTLRERNSKTVLVYCWRGGMRSAAVAWLLDLYGFKVFTLTGGYKSFRNWVLKQFGKPHLLRILSGLTGSGKTEILQSLSKYHQPVLNLEQLAGHRGSAFGDLGLPPQPHSEMFENMLALRLSVLHQEFKDQPVWVEDESSRIGDLNIHPHFFNQMINANCVYIEVPFANRLEKVIRQYGNFNQNALMSAVQRIQRKLGGTETKKVLAFLEQQDIENAFRILIRYYDKLYTKGVSQKKVILKINLPTVHAEKNAHLILEKLQAINV